MKTANEVPEKIYRKNFIYLEGKIEHSSYGIHHVTLENEMKALCTCRKLENFYKVSLMIGDKVLVEIDPLNLNPNDVVKGRIVWRMKTR